MRTPTWTPPAGVTWNRYWTECKAPFRVPGLTISWARHSSGNAHAARITGEIDTSSGPVTYTISALFTYLDIPNPETPARIRRGWEDQARHELFGS